MFFKVKKENDLLQGETKGDASEWKEDEDTQRSDDNHHHDHRKANYAQEQVRSDEDTQETVQDEHNHKKDDQVQMEVGPKYFNFTTCYYLTAISSDDRGKYSRKCYRTKLKCKATEYWNLLPKRIM